MSDELILNLVRFGVFVGIGVGILGTLVFEEVCDGFNEWRATLSNARARFMRCKKTWECLDPDGHPGPCINVKETD